MLTDRAVRTTASTKALNIYTSLRSVASRALRRFRVSLFGNNHSVALNLRYRRYHRAAIKHFSRTATTLSPSVSALIKEFRRDGFLILPSALDVQRADALKKKVDVLFDSGIDVVKVGKGLVRLMDGAERVPEIISLLPGPITEVIEGHYRSYYKLYNMSFYRTVPDESAPTSSFLWHFDNAPDEEIKLMIYLDYVTRDTGAFRFKDLETSAKIRAMGFWRRDDHAIVESVLNDASTTTVAEGKPGTAIIFQQGRIVHKATAPRESHRDVVTMCIIPSLIPWREHYARNKHLLSTNAGLCKNPWTDEPEHIGYRY